MKALKVWYGTNSRGERTEIAESINNTFYKRTYGWNGFGVNWSKWQKMDYVPKARETITNVYTLETELVPESERNQIDCGFTYLTLYKNIPNVRLPNEK